MHASEKKHQEETEWIQSDHGNQEMTQKQMTADRSRASEVSAAMMMMSSDETMYSQGALQGLLQQEQQQAWSREERDLLTNQLY